MSGFCESDIDILISGTPSKLKTTPSSAISHSISKNSKSKLVTLTDRLCLSTSKIVIFFCLAFIFLKKHPVSCQWLATVLLVCS